MSSPFGYFELRKNAKQAVNQASINQTDVKNVLLKLPSLEEQYEIISCIRSLFSKVEGIERKYNSIRQKVDSLPQSILSKAFNGNLIEQLPTDSDANELLLEIQKFQTETKKKPAKRITSKAKPKLKKSDPKVNVKVAIQPRVKVSIKVEEPEGVESNFMWLHLRTKFGTNKFTAEQVELPPRYTYDKLKEEMFDLLDLCRNLEKGARLVQVYSGGQISYQIKLK